VEVNLVLTFLQHPSLRNTHLQLLLLLVQVVSRHIRLSDCVDLRTLHQVVHPGVSLACRLCSFVLCVLFVHGLLVSHSSRNRNFFELVLRHGLLLL